MKNLGQRLKALRKERGLTQKELAAKIYAGHCSYADYEQGMRFMPADLLANAADFFGVSVDWLLGRTDDDGRGKLWTINRQFALAPLGRKLKRLREERGLTQKELAAKIYASHCSYAAYEQGKFLIPTLALVKVADFYGVSMDWLLGRTDDDGRGKLWTRSRKIVADDGGSESAPTVRPLKDGRVSEKVREVYENARETPQAPTESRGHARESSVVLKFSPAKLQAIMAERLLTQEKVARLSDLSLYAVNHTLRGKTTPKLSTIQKLAKGLGVDVMELCESDTDEKKGGNVFKFSPAKVEAIMAERHLTQKKVARLSDLSLYAVNHTLRGKTTPKLSTIQKLAKGLGVDVMELCDRVKDERSWFERVMAKYAD